MLLDQEFYEKLIINLIEKAAALSTYENKKDAAEDLKDFVDSNYHDLDKLKIKIEHCDWELNLDV